MSDDKIDALVRAASTVTGARAAPKPSHHAVQRPRLLGPVVILSIFLAVLVAVPLYLAATGQPHHVLLPLITGDVRSFFGGPL